MFSSAKDEGLGDRRIVCSSVETEMTPDMKAQSLQTRKFYESNVCELLIFFAGKHEKFEQ